MVTMKILKFANSVAAHHEPPHLDLRCLLLSLKFLNMIYLGQNRAPDKRGIEDNPKIIFLISQ